jgi:hypothetical protein
VLGKLVIILGNKMALTKVYAIIIGLIIVSITLSGVIIYQNTIPPSNIPELGAINPSTQIQVYAPTIEPISAFFYSAKTIYIHCATSGATIRYTTDGSDPLFSSTSIVYSGPFLIDKNCIIKAKAVTEYVNGETTQATYTINKSPIWHQIGTNYTASDGLTVSLKSLTTTNNHDTLLVTINYTITNNSPYNTAIGSFKMIRDLGSLGTLDYSQPQQQGNLNIGQSITESYTFEVNSGLIPFWDYITYGDPLNPLSWGSNYQEPFGGAF